MLALSLAVLGGVGVDTAVGVTPLARIEAAPLARVEESALRFDVGSRIAAELAASAVVLSDLDGALDAALRLGDDDMSIAVFGGAAVDRTRGSFVVIDGAHLPARTDASWSPRAHVGLRFHLDMDEWETAQQWTTSIAGALMTDQALTPLVRAHVAHRADSDVRFALERELSLLLVCGAAQDPARAFLWGGPGFAWDGADVHTRVWVGPAVHVDGAVDVAANLALAHDGESTLVARVDRRPFASPFHQHASLTAASLAITTSTAFLEWGASASGGFVDVDVPGQAGVRGDAVLEGRWSFELLTALVRVGVEAVAFDASSLVRAVVVAGVQL